jgi:hypothetical protein
MKLFLALFLFSSAAFARICSLDEIKRIDAAYVGENLSAFPVMTTVATYAPIMAYIPQAHKAEDSLFWTTGFVGVLGAVYFRLRHAHNIDCEDQDISRHRYRPTSAELLRFHREQRAFFWETYTWNAIWMAGLVATSEQNDKKAAAVVSMILPWAFALSRPWTAWTEDSNLEYIFYPTQDGTTMAGFSFRF